MQRVEAKFNLNTGVSVMKGYTIRLRVAPSLQAWF